MKQIKEIRTKINQTAHLLAQRETFRIAVELTGAMRTDAEGREKHSRCHTGNRQAGQPSLMTSYSVEC